ncbi:MAG: 5-oxoprolinase [Planctomycetes bacterium]|nr:5-oxoprolinase [Planctomycetota bacterium]MDP6408720.1 hydantoinase B/oxoprolinase family protein [Planctomycetota bacterium]
MADSGSDRLRLEVFHHLFAATAEEMGVSLMRSAFSPNIKERRDFSCALFDGEGRMIGQAAHLPVHLGAAPLSVAAVRGAFEVEPGDAVLLNDPFGGGTHLPDLTLVSPVFLRGAREPDFFCVNRAHHADVGGQHPGSMAPARDVHGEGLRIPPTHLVRGGNVEPDVLRLLLANMRVPEEREGDLLAQWAANRIGERRLVAMGLEHGARELNRRAGQLMDWTAELTSDLIRGLPAGAWSFEDELEEAAAEGAGRPRIRVIVSRERGRLRVDLRETDDQVAGPVNTTRAVAEAAVFYVVRLLLPAGTPTNEGVMRRVDVLTRPGSLVDARYPAPVAGGNVETSQRLVDVLLGALQRALPGRIPAASAGTMSNLTFGGRSGGRPFSAYETIAGGAGGGPLGPGAHAIQTHMTNTRNTPIEALETQLPVRVLRYTVRRGSGGGGRHPGGDGVVRRLRFLVDAQAGWVAERQERGPWGLAGGRRGCPGQARVRLAGRSTDRALGGKMSLTLAAGSELELLTPGGGGHGRARSGASLRRPGR